MKNLYFSLIIVCITFFSATVWAQTEICNNGIDDDGDGFIDCYDKDCASSPHCEDFYFGRDSYCEVTPTRNPSFSIRELWRSENKSSSTLNRPSVGDMDGDGIPEVVSVNRIEKSVYILDGRDGSTIRSRTVDFNMESDVAIAKIEPDKDAYIFLYGREGGDLQALDFNLNSVWKKKIRTFRVNNRNKGQFPGLVGLADFNGDGQVEIYYRDEIRNAHTGDLIVPGVNVDYQKDMVFSPIAVDILDDGECSGCSGLEFIVGNKIYSVNIEAGTKTEVKDMNAHLPNDADKFYPKYFSGWDENWSMVSVADVNLDGHLDVVLTGASGKPDGPTTIFLWDVKNNNVMTYRPPNNSPHGAGRVNIADVNGDGKMDMSFVSGNHLYSIGIKGNELVPIWKEELGITSISINEFTSGFTGCSVFDFDGDGAAEIVYRSEEALHIYSGKTGTEIGTAIPCRSRTSPEYPVIADVTGDGATNICVSCGTDDGVQQGGSGPPDFNTFARLGQVRVYGASNGEVWMPSRKVWNQHGYYNVNVNDDLTIPRVQQKHHVVFSETSCDGPVPAQVRPLNSFLNQAPFLNFDGCPSFPAPDLSLVDGSIDISNPPTCPDRNFNVSFGIKNDGDITFYGNISVTFYDGDPFQSGSQKLNTDTYHISALNPGDAHTITLEVQGPGSEFELFVSVNDSGLQDPIIEYPAGDIIECDYDNNVGSILVSPDPFQIRVEKIRDNFLCDEALGDNGAARAVALIGGNEEVLDYTFTWYVNAVHTDSVVCVGPEASGLKNGTYIVTAHHSTLHCGSTAETIVIDLRNEIPEEEVVITSAPQTDCSSPNGSLSVSVPNGRLEHYTFYWTLGNDGIDTIAVGANLQNLEAFTYAVAVTDILSGCVYRTTATVVREFTEPAPPVLVNVTNIITCDDDNTGAIEVGVAAGLDINNFDFQWFEGEEAKLVPDYTETGPRLEGLPIGKYTVVAVDKITRCKSNVMDPVEIIIDRNDPIFTLEKHEDQTSCAPFAANGDAEVSFPDLPEHYEIYWFEARNTLEDYEIEATRDQLRLSDLNAGWYTVKVIDTRTNCFNVKEIEILDISIQPDVDDLTVTVVDNTFCDGGSGSLTAAMAVNSGDYTYLWYDGNSVKSNTDYVGAVYPDLVGGEYTVVAQSPLGCLSEPKTVLIENNLSDPSFSETILHSTSCDPNIGLGEISLTITSAGNFDFEWYEGGFPVTGTSFSANPTVTGLTDGSYTVIVTNTETGCSENETFSIGIEEAVPQITLTSIGQTSCEPADGSIIVNTISIGGNLANIEDFEVRLYDETGTTLLTTAYDITHGFTGLEEGTYRVEVYNDVTKCTSAPVTRTVSDDRVFPVASTSEIDPQTSCDDSQPNGRIKIDVTTGGTVSPVGYEYAWYAEGLPLSGTLPEFSDSDEVANLSSGEYTVVIKDLATGCENTASFTINDRMVNPIATTTSSPQTICSPADGIAEVTNIRENGIVKNLADYDFSLYDADENFITSATGPSFEGLEAGTYYIVAENRDTKCVSGLTSVTVGENLAPITIAKGTNSRDNTSCDDATANGILEVIAYTGGVPSVSGYTYIWYDELGNEIVGETDNTLSGILHGQYTVMVTDIDTQCTFTAPYTVYQRKAIPNLTLAAVDQTWCNPNGAINVSQVEVHSYTYTPTDAEFANYTFRLYDNALNLITDAVYPFINLGHGTYFVEAVDGLLGCESEKTRVVIDYDVTPMNIQEVSMSPQYSCDALQPNGALTVDASIGSIYLPENFEYQWFEGGLPIIASNLMYGEISNSIIDKAAGTYSVRVTNTITGCVAEKSFMIGEEFIDPIVTLTSVDNTACYNGSLTASVSRGGGLEDMDDYEFFWYEGEEVDARYLIAGVSGPVLSGVKEGYYTVVARSLVYFCSSDAVLREIKDDTTLFDVLLEFEFPIPSDCNEASGTIKAYPDPLGGTYTYKYKWYESGIPSDGIFNPDDELEDETGATISDLKAGQYTLELTNDATNCKIYKSINLPYANQPSLARTGYTNNTLCSSSNGTITVELTIHETSMGVGDFELRLYEGASVSGDPSLIVQSSEFPTGTYTFENLEGGDNGGYKDYTVIAVEKLSGCGSDPVTVPIKDDSKQPRINVIDPPNDPISYCADGSAFIEVAGALAFGDHTAGSTFSYAWTADNGFDFGTNGNNRRIEGLTPGLYTVTVTNDISGCSQSRGIRVYNGSKVVQVEAVAFNRNNCSSDNGKIEILGVTENGVAASVADYEFSYFREGGIDNPIVGTLAEDIEEGTYYVKAVYIGASTDYVGCTSLLTRVEIENVTTNPLVEVDSFVEDRSCDGDVNVGTGSITLTITSADISDHNFTWYRGRNLDFGTAVPLPFTTHEATGLSEGYYTIVVASNTNSDCSTIEEVYLPKNPYEIELRAEDAAITAQSDCSPENGTIRIDFIFEDGISIPVDLNEFTFAWFYGDGTMLDPLQHGSLTANTNMISELASGNYHVEVTSNTYSCTSDRLTLNVNSITEDLNLKFDPNEDDLPDMSCDDSADASAKGTISVMVDDGTGTFDPSEYTFIWSKRDENGVYQGIVETGHLLTGMNAGDYKVEVTKVNGPSMNCTSTGYHTINKASHQITIDPNVAAFVTITDQDDCSPENGSILIRQIEVDGVTVTLPNDDYEMRWFSVSGSTYTEIMPFSGDPLIEGLAEGKYAVEIKNNKSECYSTKYNFRVGKNTPNPEIVFNALHPYIIDRSCDPNADISAFGQLSASVLEGGTHTTSGYTFTWFRGSGTTHPIDDDISGINGEVIGNLTAGFYTVMAVKDGSPNMNCASTETFYLDREFSDIEIEDNSGAPGYTVQHQTHCNPNGAIEVGHVKVNGTILPVLDFDFEWYDGQMNPYLPATGTRLENLEAGDYYIVAVNNLTLCKSDPVKVEILSQPTFPMASFVISDNTSCDFTNTNGSITVTASMASGDEPALGYDFYWYEGEGTGGTALGNSNILENLKKGYYTVEIVNLSTDCSNTFTRFIDNDLTPGVVSIEAISHMTICNVPDGSIEVSVSPGNTGDYTINWYNGTYSPTEPPVYTGPVYTGLSAGTYYVVAESPESCLSLPREIVIRDESDKPTIEGLVENLTSCNPVTPNGAIFVTAQMNFIGEPASGYEFEWFDEMGNSLHVSTDLFGSEKNELEVGKYKVVVTNLDTGCSWERTFEVRDRSYEGFEVDVRTTNNTHCTSPNGGLNANVRNIAGSFEYNWYIGSTVNATADYTGSSVTGLPEGTYTLSVFDRISECTSAPVTVVIDDMLDETEVTVTPYPVTSCVSSSPNGAISASVNGETYGYTFEWFAGNDHAMTNSLATGSYFPNVASGTYKVRVTNAITGCSNDQNVTIDNEPELVNKPTVSVVNHLTSCDAPDGRLSASVDGNTQDYYFYWYTGKNTKNEPDYRGITVTGLDKGKYTVEAVAKVTGCRSEPVTIEILEDFTYPEFTVSVVDSDCNLANGSAFLSFSIPLSKVYWELEDGIHQNIGVAGINGGTYTVTAVSTKGCSVTKQFFVGSNIIIYNGVSANGDNINDKFVIDCVDQFDGNHVRIYNRAGTLVYEASNYNNEDVAFGGEGNKGLYAGSNEMPEGTYFYVIDLKNGSKPFSGYLELVR